MLGRDAQGPHQQVAKGESIHQGHPGRRVMRGASLDHFPGQVDEYGGIVITDPIYFTRGDLHFLAGKPAGFDDQPVMAQLWISIIKLETWPIFPSLASRR